MFIRFDVIHERDVTDRHCMTAKTALSSHRAVKMLLGIGHVTFPISNNIFLGKRTCALETLHTTSKLNIRLY